MFQGIGLHWTDPRRDKGKLVAGVDMSCTDPIGDMLTSIRNAHMAEHDVVEVPHSRLKVEIVRVLKREGFISDHVAEAGPKNILRIYLKYTTDHEPVIRGLKRDSKPGLRKYVSADEIPRVLDGLGLAILSTSVGILSDKEARASHVGGEVLCSVW